MNTTDRSLEQRLTDLLAAEAPAHGPDRLAGAVLARTSQRRPRARWLTLAWETPMTLDRRPVFGSPSARVAALLVLTMLVAVLAVGSVVGGASLLPRPTGLIPPERGVFGPTGSLAIGRNGGAGGLTATLLRDGRVLVVGGSGRNAAGAFSVAPAEVWDPATGSFSPAGTLATGREGHTATLLRDGRVLVVGGVDDNGFVTTAEIWDPATSTFSPTGSLSVGRGEARAQLLSDGRVLVIGGNDGTAGGRRLSAEVWDPGTGTWSLGDTLPESRYPDGVLLDDGRILVINRSFEDSIGSVFDPVTGESTDFSPWPDLPSPHMSIVATRLQDGRVLVMGGEECVPQPEGSKTASIETAVGSGSFCTSVGNTRAAIWDPATSTFSSTGSLLEVRAQFKAALLADGRVLVVGGYDGGSTLIPAAEVFELR